MKRGLFVGMAGLWAVAALAAAPPLEALRGFQAGQWQVKTIGATDVAPQCLADAEPMLTGGLRAEGCSFSVIANMKDGATVTYRCEAGRSGRTQIRRDAHGIFKVDAQGLAGGLPFASRTEWRRTGAC
jgi:hypothetical protein